MTTEAQMREQFEKWPPSECSNKGMVNFMPKEDGGIVRIAATKNAVIVQLFDELRDKEGNLKPATSVECKDASMKEPLLELACYIAAYLSPTQPQAQQLQQTSARQSATEQMKPLVEALRRIEKLKNNTHEAFRNDLAVAIASQVLANIGQGGNNND